MCAMIMSGEFQGKTSHCIEIGCWWSLALCDDLTGLTTFIQELQGDHHKTYITDHLFGCAGINPRFCLLRDRTDAMWDRLVGTNLREPCNMTRACIPHLSSGSAIVNVFSTAGMHASAGLVIYNTTNFVIIGFFKAMTQELGPRGIWVNAFAPGSIETPTNMVVVEGEAAVAKAEKDIPLGRMGLAEEATDTACYLLSDKNSFINGAVIEISGKMYLYQQTCLYPSLQPILPSVASFDSYQPGSMLFAYLLAFG
ncbi:lung carbonyl reductase, putative [Talaromyces stipitatus ATCC 10500]|uniref:Lung carbonyl reductase, putative n=1 Tax=Talaromyces stipitatus (strain ATCC 10500 / CBS 375.48 / QM 6759 / NRRL 1006) TaxID=441959 RepID=B8LWL6_TALSN|nr:lung carbonyl reductase, putative [Talaromyces stipitatus ATCC 10500]EED24413.1 lung carbonyl reductase, putative [Talaromyces stipitatus ATCC 10500]